MIPQKIQIRNFLSYGPVLQTIDFSLYSLICLSGKNGHGKSALLDAITWAVWGQARKVSGVAKADQGLLRLGQTQMLVVFDFIFGNKHYRIRREYMETYGKPVAVLEFGLLNTDTDTLIPLTDKTIKTTQEKIEQTLGIDFDSFSNSAFLRQGNSNEFSKKSAKERKQILATILGLDQYEIIRKLAIEKIKNASNKKSILTTLQEKRTEELASEETLAEQLAEINKQADNLQQQEKQLLAEKSSYKIEQQNYAEQQKEFHNISFQLEQLNHHVSTQKQKLRELFAQWRIINKKKQSLNSLHTLEQEKNKIITAIALQQKLFQENLEHRQALLTLTQQLNTIEQSYKDEKTKNQHALQLELERLFSENKNLEYLLLQNQEHIQQLTLNDSTALSQITTHKKTLTAVPQKQQIIVATETHLEKRKAVYQHFVSLGNWINTELTTLSNKKKFALGQDPSCPLCEQNLSASRKRFLQANFLKQENFLTHRLRRLKRIIPKLKEMLINQHAQLTHDKEQLQKTITLTDQLNELTLTREKIAQQIIERTATLKKQQADIARHGEMIKNKQQQINIFDTTYTINDAHYHELLKQKQLLEDTLNQHTYSENDYTHKQQQLKDVEIKLNDHESLQFEVTQQENRKNDINQLCCEIKNINKTLSSLTQKRDVLGNLGQKLQLLQHKEKLLDLQYIALKNQNEQLIHSKGSIENQYKQLTKIKNEFTQEQSVITELDTVIDDYQIIASATGKDGIQALLIEEAIPEIEQEANLLLSRLTNNQAQIFIESLRDLKKGGTKETLDIKISDQTGIRPYELFSGGEAFRIDFALRIAISKLLARRAGTALQTLIIDEGFGSQDEEGLSHIMDALHKIQDDFSKIIIVSHLSAMKDQFPVQFFVEKGIQGSTIQVIEQG